MGKRRKTRMKPDERFWVLHVVPVRRTKLQQYEDADSLWKSRIESRREKNAPSLFEFEMNYFRWQIDQYLLRNVYRQKLTFDYFLKGYIRQIRRTPQEFAAEINVPLSRLEALMNKEELPDESIIYRLEVHSNHLIPAQQWNRLVEGRKKKRFDSDSHLLEIARLSVRNAIAVEPWGVKKAGINRYRPAFA